VTTHFNFSHDFDTDAPAFWKVFFDEEYNVDLYDHIKVKERKMLVFTETDETIHFEVKIMPMRDLPGIIKKIVGGDLGYIEKTTYYKGKDYMDVNIEPNLLKERTKIAAKYTVKALAPGKIRRSFEGDLSVDLPIVGKKVEATILEDVKRSYDIAAEVTTRWLKKGPKT
jgi:hypothetical protein